VTPTPFALLEQAVRADPGRPFVTFYDDATGERTELSVATFANWVAKTTNMLVDGLGTSPGHVLHLALPQHWLTPVWAVAAWSAGLTVDLDGDPSTAEVAVVGPAGVEAARGAGDVVALSLRPMGAPFGPGELPGAVLDYAREVPGYGDAARPEPWPGGAAVHWSGGDLDLGEVLQDAEELAALCGLEPGGRLLVAEEHTPFDELLACSLVPLLRGSGVVLLTHATPDRALSLAAAERVTARVPAGAPPGTA
jgi:uncharacterized protein (TIGR03089 family)